VAEAIVFDVNETLLDMSALDPHFERAFGAASFRERWFEQLQVLWLVTIATDMYQDFTNLSKAALEMIARKERIVLAAEDQTGILETITALPPYPDVAPALTQLREAGLRLAALTNGTLKSARAQLKHAKLEDFFEEIMSVDEAQCYKPASKPYHMAAERLRLKPQSLRLVAAHDWDITGAHAAGLQTGFVKRPRKVFSPFALKPDIAGADLIELAQKILRKDKG
jgi:2-haloacid dehalogenase